MMVMVLETVPTGLRGELTRWLIEPHPGVFVGHVSGLVRDRLWLKCCQGLRGGGVVQLWSTNNEQRFAMRDWLARVKAVIQLHITHPDPRYLGPAIPIDGDGRATRG